MSLALNVAASSRQNKPRVSISRCPSTGADNGGLTEVLFLLSISYTEPLSVINLHG
ncbi:MAG: hypothetical protein ACI936_002256 [Paraglaciecola sp.]|jgi:hypothetical protein